MTTTVTSEPANEPLTAAECKAHSRILTSADDDYLDTLIATARRHVERWTWQRLITTSLSLTLDEFPVRRLPLFTQGPIQSVSSITYEDSNGDAQTFASSKYKVSTGRTPGRISLVSGECWPATVNECDAITVAYVAGYGDDADDVPIDMRHAMLLLVAHWYENREASTLQMLSQAPYGVQALLLPYTYAEAV